jgi:hypothetical protein
MSDVTGHKADAKLVEEEPKEAPEGAKEIDRGDEPEIDKEEVPAFNV